MSGEPIICPVIGEWVHDRHVVAGMTYCPGCHQQVEVFRTSEPAPFRSRICKHEVGTTEG